MGNLNRNLKIIKCPKCLNKMRATIQSNGDLKGTCPICKSMIITKEHSNETLIRIVSKS